MVLQVILAGLLFALVVLTIWPRKPPSIPPGLWGWPLIGALPSTDVAIADQVKELRKKYGDIISWRLGSRLFIYLCNFKLIKTVFSRADVIDRPDFYSVRSITQLQEGGIVNANGQLWLNNRRFTLRHLKDLGMGKSHLGEAIEKEAQFLVEDFKKYLNKPTSLPWSINVAVLNVLWQMMAGIRYNISDEKITKFSKIVYEGSLGFEGTVFLLDIFPRLESWLPFAVKSWLGMNRIYESTAKINDFIRSEIVEARVKTFDPGNPKDYIDAYFLEMEGQKNDPNSTMNLEDLCHTLTDLFGAGSITTAMTIKWAVLYLAKYPEVQKKAQKEIDLVVSRNVVPSLDQKDKLPYIEALCYEILRLTTLATMGMPHSNEKDIELDGYRIPKNSVLIGHLECCNKDPAYWERPNDFYPEHFLDENGKLSSKREGFLPFSVGKRLCVGESLARMELYVFLAALIQNFTFTAPEGEKLSIEKNPTERILAVPQPFNIIITQRE
ncbi:cytochrome P450 2L1-like isoform X1 [Macrobrachium rosenbergii]|uniref:cytochrome P450 2L1-like isoform X1 n=1 Tax=Macrobrachium rosenbergii TaxID=79674 RepID=UPI0034D4F3F2